MREITQRSGHCIQRVKITFWPFLFARELSEWAMQQSSTGVSIFIRSIIFSYLNKIALLVLGLAYLFVLANALGPASFGKYSYIMEFAGSILALLGLETVAEILMVFIPKTNSGQLVKRLLIIQAFVALGIAALLILFSSTVVDWVREGDHQLAGWLALVMVLLPISTITGSIASGNRQFGKLFLLSLIENIGNLFFALVFVVFFQGGLVGAITARAATLIVLGFFSVGLLFHKYDKEPLSNEQKKTIVFYSKQSFVTSVFKKMVVQSNLVLLGTFVSAAALGLFYIVQKISRYLLEIPILAINDVLLPFASNEKSLEKIEKLVSKNAKFYVILSTIFSSLLAVLGPLVVSSLFPAYGESALLFLLFGIYYVFLIDVSLTTFFRAINRPQVLTFMNAIVLVNTVAVGYFLIPRFAAVGYLITLILNRIVALLVLFLEIQKRQYKIEFVPTRKDLVEFWRIFRNIVAAGAALEKSKQNVK